jgi:hypothetical protein
VPPSVFPDATGGSFNVGVTAPGGCDWAATIQSSSGDLILGWGLTVNGDLSGAKGSDNSSVTVAEQANGSGTYNGGVVNIAGQLLAVTQPPGASGAGTGGTYSLNRIEVTRTYGAGIGAPSTNPIQPGTQIYPANQLVLAYEAGWDFFWGSPASNRTRFVSVLLISLAKQRSRQ